MDTRADSQRVTLYTFQSEPVVDILEQNGVYRPEKKWIVIKYGEVAPLFLRQYEWFAGRASAICPPPEGCMYPVWTYADAGFAVSTAGGLLMELSVPVKHCVFFLRKDWNMVLNYRYLAKDSHDAELFYSQLKRYGIRDETEVTLCPHYPFLKRMVQQSWEYLFVSHPGIYENPLLLNPLFQASLWELKKEWIVKITRMKT